MCNTDETAHERISLDGHWKLGASNLESTGNEEIQAPGNNGEGDRWIDATVPGQVHLDLLRAGLISDPFYGKNAESLDWVGDQDWWYRKVFTLSELSKCRQYFLTFEGLDTFATVWLNETLVGESCNMFIPLEKEVTDELKQGENTLVVQLRSPLKEVSERVKASSIDERFLHPQIFARKSQMNYGWDFAPNVVTAGIWRPVWLDSYSTGRIRGCFVYTKIKSGCRAELQLEITIDRLLEESTSLRLEIALFDARNKRVLTAEEDLPSTASPTKLHRYSYGIQRIHLWYPHNIGDPYCYTLNIRLQHGTHKIDEWTKRIGFREVELVKKEDGEDVFYFRVNGIRTFAKGGNWVAADAFPPRITQRKYEQLLHMVKDANMNMLRVWGGGIVEDDVFYDLCDELGIMIWQDFMYACARYPEDDEDIDLAKQEGRAVIERLRNHPSIVLWCGDNECEWVVGSLHIVQKEVIDTLCNDLDPTRPYWPSSPHGGQDPNSSEQGDRHNWDVWHERLPYHSYSKDSTRFCSEFGLQAFPVMRSLSKFIPKEELENPNSDSLVFHNLQWEKLSHYLEDMGRLEEWDLCDYVRFSQLVQAEAYKSAIEHFRRNPLCGGCLFWQVNEPWPAVCWSVIDYYLEPKMAYFIVKEAFRNLILSIEQRSDELAIWICNGTGTHFKGKLELLVSSFEGKEMWNDTVTTAIEPFTCETVYSLHTNSCIRRRDTPSLSLSFEQRRTCFLQGRFVSEAGISAENVHLFARQRDLQLPRTELELHAVPLEGRDTSEQTFLVTVKTNGYARIVELRGENCDMEVERNFFDLPPHEKTETPVTIRHAQDDPVVITAKALNSTEARISLGL